MSDLFHRPNPPFDHARFFLVLGGIRFDRVFDILVIELFTLIYPHLQFPFLNMVSNAEATDFPILSFNGIKQPYLEKTSMTARRYFTPRLNLKNACIFTKSAAHISSIPLTKTLCLLNFLLIGLFNSSARLFFNSHPKFYLRSDEFANDGLIQPFPERWIIDTLELF